MGARGSVGKYVLDNLISRGLPVRASTRSLQPGQFPDGVDVFSADLTDPGSLDVAFEGMGQVFLYANHEGVHGVIGAARRAGVEKVVLMSSGSIVHETSTGNAITEEHRGVEEAFVAARDIAVVPIRPLVLATNALGWSYPVKAGAVLPLYKPDAVTAPIHERDIAAVALAALLGNESPRISGMLTGPARLSQRDQVALIAAAIGKDIPVVELTRAEALTSFTRFMPAAEAEAVLQFLDDADIGNSPATSTVEDVLERPAIGFEVWAADHVADFTTAGE
jgi:uncharacterized protein YbjT (DUF2867 family)